VASVVDGWLKKEKLNLFSMISSDGVVRELHVDEEANEKTRTNKMLVMCI
jgi:hypothetical protein